MKFIIILSIIFTFSFSAKLDKVKLYLKWKHQFQFAGFYMAKEKGYYKDLGLKVDIREENFNRDTTKIILNNENAFGISDSILIYEKMLGAKIKILGAILQHDPSILIYLQKSGIKSPEDFRDKKIMIDLSASDNAFTSALITKYNLKEKNINYVSTSYSIDDLINGKVDIYTAYTSNEPFLLDKKNIKYNFIKPKDFGIDFYGDMIFTSELNIKKNPNRVKNFYDASLKGWKYAFENIDETVKLIQKKYNTQNFSYEKLLFEANELKKLSEFEMGNLGKIELNKINHIISTYFLSENKLDMKNINNLDIYSIINDHNYIDLKLTDNEIKYLKKKKVIKYCNRNDYLPYSTLEKGKYKGILIDYINEIQNKLNINFKAVETDDWTQCCELIKNDEIDFASLILKEPNDYSFLEPSNSFLDAYLVLATKINEPFILNMDSLSNKVIGISKYAINIIKLLKTRYPNLNIRKVDTWKEGLQLISNGELYGYIGPSDTVSFGIQEEYAFELKIMNRLDNTLYPGSMGIRKGNNVLLSIINKAIDNIDEKKSREIRKNWVTVRHEPNIDYTMLWTILSVFSVLFLAFMYRQFILRKTNIELEKTVRNEVEKNREKDKLLFQQTKLASMGEMLNNIAHQWRQPLNAINSSVAVIDASLMKKGIDDDHIEKNLSEIESQTSYMSDTIESFRIFFNPLKAKKDFLLSEAVEDVLRIIKYDYENNGIKIKVFKQKDITVRGYLGEYIQIIISILNNSKDAFLIKEIKNPEITIYIDDLIIIDDNAGGISDDIIDRVFEPYFTTKHKEKGTGTGLYMAKMIVEHSMDGSLTIQQIKNGTRFKIIV